MLEGVADIDFGCIYYVHEHKAGEAVSELICGQKPSSYRGSILNCDTVLERDEICL